MIRCEEGRRRTFVDFNDNYVNNKKPLFGQINGAPRCGISLHATPTKTKKKKRDVTEAQYLLQGKCKFFRKKTTHVCLDCADTEAVKNEMWVCQPKRTFLFCTECT